MRTLLPLLAAAVLTATLVQPAAAADNPTWSPALSSGSGVGVAVQGGAARIDQRTAFRAPREDGAAEGTPDTAVAHRPAHPRPHRLDSPTNRIAARVAARLTEGATADVDVRGLRAGGNWSEWIPAEDGTAVLPEPVLDVQARLVLTGDPGPEATGLTLTALATVQVEGARAEGNPLSYKIFATREGLVGGTTANGHVITPARPLRRAALPPGAVAARQQRLLREGLRPHRPLRVRAGLGRRPVEHPRRLLERPRRARSGATCRAGIPQAQAAKHEGLQRRQGPVRAEVVNPAGIDLADGMFWDALGLRDNAWVTVDYLWTGRQPAGDGRVDTAGWTCPRAGTRRRGHRPPQTGRRPRAVRDGRLAADRRRAVPARPRRCLAAAVAAAPPGLRLTCGTWRVSGSGSRARARARCRRPCRRCSSAPGAAVGSGTVAPGRALLALVVAVALVIGVNYANDYSDGIRGTDDDRVGPVRLVGSRLAAPAAVRTAAFLCFAVAGAGRADAGVADAAVVADRRRRGVHRGRLVLHRRPATLRLRRARRGGRVRVLRAGRGARHGADAERAARARSRSSAPSASGLLACAVLVVNNLRDIPTATTAVGKRTLAVALGDRDTRRLYAALRPAAARLLSALGRDPQLADAARPARAAAGGRRARRVLGGADGRAAGPGARRPGLLLLAWSVATRRRAGARAVA